MLDLEVVKVKVTVHENINDKSLTTKNGLKELKKITPAVVAIIPTMGTGEGRPRIGPHTR